VHVCIRVYVCVCVRVYVWHSQSYRPWRYQPSDHIVKGDEQR
jgi:hypothetical protein